VSIHDPCRRDLRPYDSWRCSPTGILLQAAVGDRSTSVPNLGGARRSTAHALVPSSRVRMSQHPAREFAARLRAVLALFVQREGRRQTAASAICRRQLEVSGGRIGSSPNHFIKGHTVPFDESAGGPAYDPRSRLSRATLVGREAWRSLQSPAPRSPTPGPPD
jgi:hypothetical protein